MDPHNTPKTSTSSLRGQAQNTPEASSPAGSAISTGTAIGPNSATGQSSTGTPTKNAAADTPLPDSDDEEDMMKNITESPNNVKNYGKDADSLSDDGTSTNDKDGDAYAGDGDDVLPPVGEERPAAFLAERIANTLNPVNWTGTNWRTLKPEPGATYSSSSSSDSSLSSSPKQPSMDVDSPAPTLTPSEREIKALKEEISKLKDELVTSQNDKIESLRHIKKTAFGQDIKSLRRFKKDVIRQDKKVKSLLAAQCRYKYQCKCQCCKAKRAQASASASDPAGADVTNGNNSAGASGVNGEGEGVGQSKGSQTQSHSPASISNYRLPGNVDETPELNHDFFANTAESDPIIYSPYVRGDGSGFGDDHDETTGGGVGLGITYYKTEPRLPPTATHQPVPANTNSSSNSRGGERIPYRPTYPVRDFDNDSDDLLESPSHFQPGKEEEEEEGTVLIRVDENGLPLPVPVRHGAIFSLFPILFAIMAVLYALLRGVYRSWQLSIGIGHGPYVNAGLRGLANIIIFTTGELSVFAAGLLFLGSMVRQRPLAVWQRLLGRLAGSGGRSD
ncbi:hypothetical protein B0T17DRAFT_657312 [Bombardia bombarda]|uniref:Uncharacterized protein n=1 Tax=Bombardia bombarda TaxID=252184 RepID=A0AA40BVD5_9PEZI|nr:hypothetical protein B0T17DRAFT_657312 [Bombardia bombarda]